MCRQISGRRCVSSVIPLFGSRGLCSKETVSKSKKDVLDPNYKFKFKCGLEIHCQLKTKRKLFSLSEHGFNQYQNSRVSFFDCALPGTQPKLNPEAVLLALVAGVALNSKINTQSTFDRKHYFYSDQPTGYQITQHYNPICKGGFLKLNKKFDEIDEDEKIVTLDQIQIEQDTGKSIHVEQGLTDIAELSDSDYVKIDLNRANIPLIEVVTNPDFENLKQVKAFVKKFQALVKYLSISTAELETGAMRVDVNVSVNDGNRVEIKNLSSSSAIISALKYEYKRQIQEILAGNVITQETRGWNGSVTTKLRNKETKVDYRYVPDAELSPILLEEDIVPKIKQKYVHTIPDDIYLKLIKEPYNLRVKDAKLLVGDTYEDLLDYYLDVFGKTAALYKEIPSKIPGNFILHELIGQFKKRDLEFKTERFPSTRLIELIKAIYIDKKLTNTSGKLLFSYLVENIDDETISKMSVDELIEEFELESPSLSDSAENVGSEIDELCSEIINKHHEIVANLKQGKKMNSLKYLVGQAMRATQGKIDARTFETHLKTKIGLE